MVASCATLRALQRRVVQGAPLNRVGDQQHSRLENGAVRTPDGFAAAYKAFAEGGWTGLAADAAHGGQGLPKAMELAVFEMVNAANMAFALCPTLSIAAIEVILISAVMLGPGEHPTIARDSVMAVSMIILNLVIGVALLVSGIRHPRAHANRTGVSTYLAVLIVLLAVAFALPGLIGVDGGYAPGHQDQWFPGHACARAALLPPR